MHAYAAERPGTVRLTVATGAQELTVLVSDSGCGLGSAGPSLGLGLGLGLLEQACDALSISTRGAGGTLIEMRFALPAAQAHSARSQPRGSVRSATRAASPRFSTMT